MTRSAIRAFVETAVAWVDIAMLVAGFVVCTFLAKAFLLPAPQDRHGGGFALIGLLLLIPAMSGALVAWLSMRRRERWRWWAQLLPCVRLVALKRKKVSGGR